MYCSKCGHESPEGATHCVWCALPLRVPGTTYGQSNYPTVPRTSGYAIASLVLSICAGFIGWVAGLVLGYLALKEIRESGGTVGGRGLAMAGIIISYSLMGLFVVAVIVIIIIGVSTTPSTSIADPPTMPSQSVPAPPQPAPPPVPHPVGPGGFR